jgi:hypothetical protein
MFGGTEVKILRRKNLGTQSMVLAQHPQELLGD